MRIAKCILIFITTINMVNAQPYKKMLPDDGGLTWHNYEAYDKGFYLFKPFYSNNSILKVDANGNKLWQRDIRSDKYYLNPTAIYPTDDGGVLVGGYSSLVDSTGSFFLMKLNACGEKEWCKDYDKGNYISNAYVFALYKNGENYIMGCQSIISPDNYGSYYTFDTLGNMINQFHIKNHDAVYRYFRYMNPQYCFAYSSIYTYVYPHDTNAIGTHSCNIGIDTNGDCRWIDVVGVDSGNFVSRSLNAVNYRNGFAYGGGNCMGNALLTKLNGKGNISWLKYIGKYNPLTYENGIHALNFASDSTLLIGMVTTEILNFNAEYSTVLYLCDTAANIKDSLVFGDTGTMEKYRCLDILNTSDGNFLLIFQYKKGPGDSDFVYLQKINNKLQTVNFDTATHIYDWKCGHAVKPYDSINIDDAKRVKILYDSTKFITYVHYPASINNIVAIKYTVNLYPNPATDILHIDLSDFSSLHNLYIELIDMTGKTIIQQKVSAGTNIHTLDIQNIAVGTYNVVVLSGNEKLSWSMVVKH